MRKEHGAAQGPTRGAQHGPRGHGGDLLDLLQGWRGGLRALAVGLALSACGSHEPPPPLVPYSKVDPDDPSLAAPPSAAPASPRRTEEPARPESEAAAAPPNTSEAVGERPAEDRAARRPGPEKITANERVSGGSGDAATRSVECKKLLGVIDAEDKKSEKLVPADGSRDLNILGPAAQNLDGSAKAIGDVELTDPELIRHRKGLVEIYKDLASSTRAAQSSIKSGNVDKAVAAVEQLKRGQAASQQRMGELNAYCKGGS